RRRRELERAVPRDCFLIDDERRAATLETEWAREVVLRDPSADVLRSSIGWPVAKIRVAVVDRRNAVRAGAPAPRDSDHAGQQAGAARDAYHWNALQPVLQPRRLQPRGET